MGKLTSPGNACDEARVTQESYHDLDDSLEDTLIVAVGSDYSNAAADVLVLNQTSEEFRFPFVNVEVRSVAHGRSSISTSDESDVEECARRISQKLSTPISLSKNGMPTPVLLRALVMGQAEADDHVKLCQNAEISIHPSPPLFCDALFEGPHLVIGDDGKTEQPLPADEEEILPSLQLPSQQAAEQEISAREEGDDKEKSPLGNQEIPFRGFRQRKKRNMFIAIDVDQKELPSQRQHPHSVSCFDQGTNEAAQPPSNVHAGVEHSHSMPTPNSHNPHSAWHRACDKISVKSARPSSSSPWDTTLELFNKTKEHTKNQAEQDAHTPVVFEVSFKVSGHSSLRISSISSLRAKAANLRKSSNPSASAPDLQAILTDAVLQSVNTYYMTPRLDQVTVSKKEGYGAPATDRDHKNTWLITFSKTADVGPMKGSPSNLAKIFQGQLDLALDKQPTSLLRTLLSDHARIKRYSVKSPTGWLEGQ